MSARLGSVQPVLMSSDVARSVRFYERLGFTTIFQDRAAEPRYAAVLRDRVELHLQWQDESQWSAAADRPTYRFPVEDVDGLYAEFRDRGVAGGRASAGSPWAEPAATP